MGKEQKQQKTHAHTRRNRKQVKKGIARKRIVIFNANEKQEWQNEETTNWYGSPYSMSHHTKPWQSVLCATLSLSTHYSLSMAVKSIYATQYIEWNAYNSYASTIKRPGSKKGKWYDTDAEDRMATMMTTATTTKLMIKTTSKPRKFDKSSGSSRRTNTTPGK